MKNRRLIALFLVLCLFSSVAGAEAPKDGSAKDRSVLDWLKQTWEDVSSHAGEARDKASEWMTEIWGNASSWISDKYGSASESVSKWLTDTFNSVTAAKDNTWAWIDEQSQPLRSTLTEEYGKMQKAVQDGVSDAGESIKNAFTKWLMSLNLNPADVLRVMETIRVYAEKIGIPTEKVEQILLPYLIDLAMNSEYLGETIPAVGAAQYLTGIFDSLDLTTPEQAQEAVDSLSEALGTD